MKNQTFKIFEIIVIKMIVLPIEKKNTKYCNLILTWKKSQKTKGFFKKRFVKLNFPKGKFSLENILKIKQNLVKTHENKCVLHISIYFVKKGKSKSF